MPKACPAVTAQARERGADASPRKVFAQRFAELYAAAGNPAMRKVAAAAEVRMAAAKGRNHVSTASAQRISDWKAGRNVPARFESLLPVLLILVELARKADPDVPRELVDVQLWRRLWIESDKWTPEPDPAEMVCPYRGLTSYRCADAAMFFGRTRPTELFAELVRGAVTGAGAVVLVGASGAGKSSLLHAGLLPAVATPSDEWAVATLTPGAAPLTALAAAVGEQADPADGRRLVLVDQLEELFTACAAERDRRAFLAALGELAARPDTAVVLAIRADFYARCLDYAVLEDALKHRSFLLGPMRLEELAEAITGPAERVGMKLEPGLENLVVSELCGVGENAEDSGYDPGALPLLSHVMAATWERREGKRLTIAGYRKAGGVLGSVAATAEGAWEQLTPGQRGAAKQLLLGLVTVGRDSRDTRRRVSRAELMRRASGAEATRAALEALARTRLITLDDTVFLTHEIVLDAWPRLRGWIDEDRVGYLIRQRLEADAMEWDATGRDSSLLYRGARLLTAVEHAGRGEPGPVATEFLAAAQAARKHAQRRASTAKGVQALLAIVVLALGLAAYAQNRVADKQRSDRLFGEVMSEASRLSDLDPTLSAQLDLVADRLRPNDPDVRARLLSTQNMPLATVIPGSTGPIKQLAYRRDGKVLASAGHDNTVRLWDVADPLHPHALGPPLTGHREFMTSAAFRPDGRLLASAGGDKTVRLWDVADPAHPRPVGAPLIGGAGTVYLLAFSPDGRMLAAPNDDHTVALWDLTDPAAPVLRDTVIRGNGAVRAVAFSPDGRTLAIGGDDRTVQLWDVTDIAAPSPLGPPLDGFGGMVRSVAFSPDGAMLAAGSVDTTVRLWDLTGPASPRPLGSPLTGHTSEVWSVAFAPDGRTLVSGSTDGTARLWNLQDPLRPRVIGQPLYNNGSALSAVFSPDGRMVAVGGHDGSVRLWSLPSVVLSGHGGRVATPVFSADGALMATGSEDGVIQLWNTRDPRTPRPVGRLALDEAINSVALSPDGRTAAIVDESASNVRLFDVADPTAVTPLAQLSPGTRYTYELAFSPDSRHLLTGSDDHSVQIWDLADRTRPAPLADPVPVSDGFVSDAKFSPDGLLLAVAAGGRGTLWDVSDLARPVRVGPDLSGPTNAVRRVAFSPDRRTLVTAGDDAVRLWDVSDPRALRRRGDPLTGHTSAIDSVAVSPDGRTVASGGEDSSVQLWDITDPDQPAAQDASIALPTTPTWDVAFDPAGGYLAGSGEGGALRMWDLDIHHAITRICDITGATLTPRVWQEHLPQLPYTPPC